MTALPMTALAMTALAMTVLAEPRLGEPVGTPVLRSGSPAAGDGRAHRA